MNTDNVEAGWRSKREKKAETKSGTKPEALAFNTKTDSTLHIPFINQYHSCVYKLNCRKRKLELDVAPTSEDVTDRQQRQAMQPTTESQS